mmetsp:Transcript_8432/g.19357  ORF Transcript_8432/g.19357 Transcript_8432/m.19357 type:complete len:384 (-) Transcript_8432:53-1204(-)
MCGRAYYSERSVDAAAQSLCHQKTTCGTPSDSDPGSRVIYSIKDSKKNSGPGHTFRVIYASANGSVKIDEMIWGLIPNGGSISSPHRIPTDEGFSVSPHYKMFNARSETVHEKVSFARYIRSGQVCIFAVDGYYEWTQPIQQVKKQPYFVRSRDLRQPLLLAGVYARVKTGREDESGKDEMISTFAVLTADAHPQYAWLHPRQPLMIPDLELARAWLKNNPRNVLEEIRDIAGSTLWDNLSVYPVTTKMNDARYQGDDCATEIKLKKVRSIQTFFSPRTAHDKIETEDESKSAVKKGSKPKRKCASGGIESFFKREKDTEPKPVAGSPSETSPSAEIAISWQCSTCTYVHSRPEQMFYLACDICGSPRKVVDLASTKKPKTVR